MNAYLSANRQLWDVWMLHHVSSDFYDVAGFKAGRNTLDEIEVAGVGDRSRLVDHRVRVVQLVVDPFLFTARDLEEALVDQGLGAGTTVSQPLHRSIQQGCQIPGRFLAII